MTNASARLAGRLAVWPFDREQRGLVKNVTVGIGEQQAQGLIDLLQRAETAVTSCANFLMDETQFEQGSRSKPKAAVKPPIKTVRDQKDLNDLFLGTLKDIYFAEKQIWKALLKMAKAAQSDKLRLAFEKHRDETEGQIDRLEQVFMIIGSPARGRSCYAIRGIVDESKEIIEKYKGSGALDAGLIAAAQAIEHYEISRYGTLKAWALQLGMKDAARLFDVTLTQEKRADAVFSELSMGDLLDEYAQSA